MGHPAKSQNLPHILIRMKGAISSSNSALESTPRTTQYPNATKGSSIEPLTLNREPTQAETSEASTREVAPEPLSRNQHSVIPA